MSLKKDKNPSENKKNIVERVKDRFHRPKLAKPSIETPAAPNVPKSAASLAVSLDIPRASTSTKDPAPTTVVMSAGHPAFDPSDSPFPVKTESGTRI